MAKEFIAGISFSDKSGQLALIELQPDGIELHHLEEFQNPDSNELWFLDPLLKRNAGGLKISKASIAFDNASVFLHGFPLDSSLSQPEQNEQVQWELSNYIENFKPKEYITDVRTLRTRSKEQISEVLTVSVPRSLVFNIQHALSSQNIDLELVDTNYFCAYHALSAVHTEIKIKTVTLAGISKNRIDAGTIMYGRAAGYRYAETASVSDTVHFLEEYMKADASSDLFLFGSDVSFDLLKALRAKQGINVVTLNPFRKLRVSTSFRGFDKFIGHENRFASCVGALLRK